jgi:hypothetical protein
MDEMRITEHSMKAWQKYDQAFGFVPDPMILRAGEIFLNGASSAKALGHSDFDVWRALRENVGAISDFFDFVVVRDKIPLINYGDTFDRIRGFESLDALLAERVQPVEIDYAVYNEVKAGAIENLARVDFRGMSNVASVMHETEMFRYDWQPRLAADPQKPTPGLEAAIQTLSQLPASHHDIARFLLGGFIFSGFAQASGSIHHVQPKRARMFLGLTAAPEHAGHLSHQDEAAIFTAAKEKLEASEAKATWGAAAPPVLPYLLDRGGDPKSPRELLDRALEFRESREGEAFRAFVADLRADGPRAGSAAAVSEQRRREAAKLLQAAPEDARSASLDIELSLTGPKAKTTVAVPSWLRLWWNDWASFDRGLRKTLRRMWLADGAYKGLDERLRKVWTAP